MKKLIGLTAMLLFTGCACTSKRDKADLYHTAAVHANQRLSECSEENMRMRIVLQRQQRQIVGYKRARNPTKKK